MLTFPITNGGQEGYGILVAGAGDGDSGGGLCVWDGSQVDVIDRLSSTGLCMCGDRLIRCLRTGDLADGGEILGYDARGVDRYYRMDEFSDVHYVLWHEGNLIVSNTGCNEILWVTPYGEIVRRWRAPGERDSWHLNDVTVHEGRLLACAFGRYPTYRGYKERQYSGDGIVFDVETGKDVLTGLCGPHHPRFFDGRWTVCNSLCNEVLQIEHGSGTVIRRLNLGRFTRGVAITDDLLLVGESAARSSYIEGETAAVAVISRRDWKVLGRVPIPFREISDILPVPLDLVQGLKAGFRTNPLRVSEHDQLSMFEQAGIAPRTMWALSGRLQKDQIRAKVEANIPKAMKSGNKTPVQCVVKNCGDGFFFSAPPFPVHLSYKWLHPNGVVVAAAGEGIRREFTRGLPPQASEKCWMEVMPPPVTGEFILRITLVQELVTWFDEVDLANSYSSMVVVE